MSRSSRYLLLLGVLLLAGFFRFYQLTAIPPGLYMDEAMDGNNAVEVAETGQFKSFYPEDNGREGLYVNVLAVMFKVHPCAQAWCVRLPSAVAGVLTVAGTYLLAEDLLGAEAGFFSAFFMAAGFWPVLLSRVGFRANFAVLLLVWAVFFFWRALHREGRTAWIYGLAAGVVYGLSFYTYIPIRITPLLFVLAVVFFHRRRGTFAKAGVFALTAIVVAAPLALHFLHTPQDFSQRTSQISVMSSNAPLKNFLRGVVHEVAMVSFHGDRNWRHNIFKSPELFLPVGLLFWFGLLYGIGWLVQRGRSSQESRTDRAWTPQAIAFWLAWYALALVPASAAMDVPSALRGILLLPPVFAFAGLGCAKLLSMTRNSGQRFAMMALLGAICVASLVYTGFRYFVVCAHDPHTAEFFDEEDAMQARRINALPAGVTKYIVVASYPNDAYERGLPLVAQTTMFLTRSFTRQDRDAANIHYVLDRDEKSIPHGVPTANVFHVGRIRN